MIVEVIHGILRTLFLVPSVGDLRARQIGVFVGAGLILGITTGGVTSLGDPSRSRLLAIGGMWVVLTVTFEIVLGVALGASADRIVSDYDMRRGGLMPLGLLAEFLSPYLAARFRGLSIR